jgi:cell division septation protein DedD
MNNVKRGIYRPLGDVVPIYDLEQEQRSRAPLPVVVALSMLAAFAAVVAYTGVERGRQGASLAITAPEGPPPRSRALSGAVVLQLGAFDSQELANGAWARFRARYPGLAGLSQDVQRANLGAKGVVYRLRVGPFADRTAATDACVQLKAAGTNCFVAVP